MQHPEHYSADQLRFQLATEADAARLIQIVNAAFAAVELFDGDRVDGPQMAEALRNGALLMAKDEAGRLLGSVAMEVRGQSGYLGMLAVAPEYQQRGLARLLVAEAIRRLHQKSCHKVEILVLNVRSELRSMYRRWGFVEQRTIAFHFTHPIPPGCELWAMIEMVKPIPEAAL